MKALFSAKACLGLFFGICISFGLVQAQDDWLPGYVVTQSGDTLRGEVRDRDSGPFPSLYDKVKLRDGRKRRKFSPQRLMAYHRGNQHFITLQTVTTSRLLKTETRVVSDGGEYGFWRLEADGPLQLLYQEFVDEDNLEISVPYFKRRGDARLVRATQGLFGLKKKLLSDYFSDRSDLVKGIRSGRLKTPLDVVNAY